MYNKKIIEGFKILEDRIELFYDSKIKRTIKDKYIVLFAKKKASKSSVKYFIEDINNYIEKVKEYRKNKYILTFSKLNKILKANKNGFYSTYRRVIDNKIGYVYVLDKSIDTSIFKNFKNVKIGIRSCNQAPELKSSIIWIEGIKNNNLWY